MRDRAFYCRGDGELRIELPRSLVFSVAHAT